MEPVTPLSTPTTPASDLPTLSASGTAANEAVSASFPTLSEGGLPPAPPGPPEPGSLRWIFVGSNGLRTGWSIAIFLFAMGVVMTIVGLVLHALHLLGSHSGMDLPVVAGLTELAMLSGLAGSTALVALIERRKRNLLEYNLIGPARLRYFLTGLVAGFAALSLLVGVLKAGGWITLAPSGTLLPQLIESGLLWGLMFLTVGLYEEGTFRCYLQATLTRGINLWWALGLEAVMCGFLVWRGKGNGAWGVYLMALLGLLPCLYLSWKKAESRGFWLAAWVASTLFGFVHTGNNGENPVGIFAAAAIGFVFVVSVRLTGSAWWAIGFHSAWDWAETYFYGTADSGMQAQGSLLVAKPAGNPFWSGGSDGPEGSLLVLAVILLTLVGIVLVYGRKKTLHAVPAEQV